MEGLTALGPDLFGVESRIRFYGVELQTRMAVVRLAGGRLLLYSPVQPTPERVAALGALGTVAWVVSPNKIHNQTLAACRAAWPGALLVAPPGLPERRKDLRFDAVLGEAPVPDWGASIDVALTGGNVFFSEALVLHRRSRTLLVGDLVENLRPGTATRLGLRLARIFGVPQRPVASPEFRLYTHDAEAAEASLAPVLAWDFERIFLCHGALVEHDAKRVFRGVVDELLTAVRRRGALSKWVLRGMARLQ